MFDIYRYVADNMTGSLEHEISQLKDISDLIESDQALKLFDYNDKYGVYHKDPKILFLAKRLLEKTGIRMLDSDEQGNKYIALSELPVQQKNAGCIPVFKLMNSDRRGSISCLYKYLQWHLTGQVKIDSFVMFDLETTDRDPETCDIVEFAAARVRNGKIVATIESLIKPDKPVSPAAQKVHGIKPQQLIDKPSILGFWKELRAFIGEDILIAHNGYNFDFPILDRIARKLEGKKLNNARFDTLVLARNLFPGESNSIDSLMNRYNLSSEKRHRALEDVKILVKIFDKLQNVRISNARKISLEMFLDIVSLGNYIENNIDGCEDRIFFIGGARKLITPYSEILVDFCREFKLDEHERVSSIRNRLERVQPGFQHFSQDENLLTRLREIGSKFNHLPVGEAIAGFLGQVALQQAQDDLRDINVVSLLTYHAAKGLEFDKVILIGLEKDSMPGFHAARTDDQDDRPVLKKMEEQRRLFYVGMTRAKSETSHDRCEKPGWLGT